MQIYNIRTNTHLSFYHSCTHDFQKAQRPSTAFTPQKFHWEHYGGSSRPQCKMIWGLLLLPVIQFNGEDVPLGTLVVWCRCLQSLCNRIKFALVAARIIRLRFARHRTHKVRVYTHGKAHHVHRLDDARRPNVVPARAKSSLLELCRAQLTFTKQSPPSLSVSILLITTSCCSSPLGDT